MRTAGEIVHVHASEAQLPQLIELALFDDWYVIEVVGSKIAELAGINHLSLLLQALEKGLQLGHDCDGLQANIIGCVEMEAEKARPILQALIHSKDSIQSENAKWLYEFIEENHDR